MGQLGSAKRDAKKRAEELRGAKQSCARELRQRASPSATSNAAAIKLYQTIASGATHGRAMTEVRHVKALEWARPCQRPSCIPVGRPRGAKAQGLRYERLLAKRLPLAKHGQWFKFADTRLGHGYCQPDFLLELPNSSAIVVLECKYTWTVDGHLQLERLYLPVVELVFKRRAVGIQVCKRLDDGMRGTTVTGDLKHAIQLALSGCRPVFHWLGKATISLPSPRYLEKAA